MVANILYFHSVLRYFVLLFMLMVIVQSLVGMLGKGNFKKINKTGALLLMIVCDVQLLLGIAIYIYNGWANKITVPGAMKDHVSRFYGLEHPLIMIIAIVLIHIGYSAIKKNTSDDRKFKVLFWCTVISLFLVLSRVPWPGMREVGRPYLPIITHAI